MLGLAVALNLFGMWRLRVWNPSGEPIMQREKPEEAGDGDRERVAEAEPARPGRTCTPPPGVARPVRGNPILWREIFTRAYGRRPLLVKLAYAVVLALICYSALGAAGRAASRACRSSRPTA